MYSHGFFLLILCLVVGIDAQSSTVTLISTQTVTETTVTVFNTRTICVVYMNASVLCRRRRQFWVDHPIILSFDDDDDDLDQLLQPQAVLR